MNASRNSASTYDIRSQFAFQGPSVISTRRMIALSLRTDEIAPETSQTLESWLSDWLAKRVAETRSRRSRTIIPKENDALKGAGESGAAGLLAALAVQLQAFLGHDVRVWSLGRMRDSDADMVALEYRHEPIGRLATQVALSMLDHLLDSADAWEETLDGLLEQFLELADKLELTQVGTTILEEADARGIPWRRVPQHGYVLELGQGYKRKRFYGSYTDRDGYIGSVQATDKEATTSYLRDRGVPVPENFLVPNFERARAAAERLGYPVVVKPNSADYGTAVHTNLTDETELRRAYDLASRHGRVLVEKHVPGDHHRLLVLHGRYFYTIVQFPAKIVGDGEHSIEELIAIENRERGETFGVGFFKKLKVDDQVLGILKAQGHDLQSVPPDGSDVALRLQANMSQGGTGHEVTEETHEDNKRLAERIARLVGLSVVGIDFITTDISKPLWKTGGAICEINPTPGWLEADERRITTHLLEPLFPDRDQGRIPLVSVIGAKAGHEVAAQIARLLGGLNLTLGRAGAAGAWIGDERVGEGDLSGSAGCRMVLYDPAVQAAVLETSREKAFAEGLGYDRSNVTVLLPEDAGLDPMRQSRVSDLAAATTTGLLVLGVDDPDAARLAETMVRPRLCLVGSDRDLARLEAHAAAGGRAVVASGPAGFSLLGDWKADLPGSLLSPDDGNPAWLGFALAAGLGLQLKPEFVFKGLNLSAG